MKILNFKGFSNLPSSCEYAIGELDGHTAIVFYQRDVRGTSITNMIESLTMHVLAHELPGTPPESVRVFQHISPELKPAIEWQEVIFGSTGPIEADSSIVRGLVDIFTQSDSIPEYFVDDPLWRQVSEDEKETLSLIT
ncbi:MAG: hypothetical protein Q7W55_05800 [Pseudohongiella sp.]|nr:hypothetical protein [Pseudohongiella sp.]MDO9518745.1 hypothetical protein [Pseudohongiella sp.]MDP2126783.1 hypothetical protein [Pseudohongiella sp.]